MSGVIKVAVFVIVWEFIVATSFVLANVMIYEYVEPTFDDLANTTDFVDYDRYVARKTPVLMGFNVALFVLAILPFVYLFVRLLLKREQTAPPDYRFPQTFAVNPKIPGISGLCMVNSGGGSHVRL